MIENPVREWYIVGPFDNPKGVNGSNDVFPPEQQVNLNDAYEGKNRQKIRWQEFSATRSGLMNFEAAFSGIDYAVAYGLSYVWSPEELTTQLKTGSDDGIKVWLNGKVVLEKSLKRGAVPDTDVEPVSLKKGWNEVLVKNVEEVGNWGFYLRFEDPDKKLKYSRRKN